MTDGSEPHAEYMFGFLAYETWKLAFKDESIGVVTLNGPDNLVAVTLHEGFQDWGALFEKRSFSWWMHWLGLHQRSLC